MIVVDVETTGLDSKKNSIVSIGAVDFLNPLNQFYEECRIWREAEIVQKALEINGFTEEEVRSPNKKTLEKTIKEFAEWLKHIKDITIAGENPFFDRDFLYNSAERYGIDLNIGHRIIDLHTLCYSHFLKRGIPSPKRNKRSDLNADGVFEYVGLPMEPRPHKAITGAKMEAEAFSRLIYGKPLLEEFEEYPIPNYL